MCCGVYNGFIHTGVVIDHNAILELHGSGLARAVSYKRFLANRSGANIFVASDALGHPLNTKLEVNRVSSELFAYHKYHISKLIIIICLEQLSVRAINDIPCVAQLMASVA